MDYWRSRAQVAYRRWRNPQLRSEANSVGQSNEDQGTDNEICTVTSGVDLEGRKFAPGSEFDKTEETYMTVEDVLEAIGFGKFQWKMSILTGMSFVGDAMELMILSILGPALHCEWRLPGYQVALLTSMVFIGMMIGSPAWGAVSDTYGRKGGLTIAVSWAFFYGLLSCFSPVYGWLLALRFLAGFGTGGAPQSVTMYSEFLPVKSRGISIMMMQAFWAIGSLFEVLLGFLVMPHLGWRWLLGLSTIPMAIFIIFCYWLPESARFNVLTGKSEKAMATLARIAKENGKPMPQGKLICCNQDERGRIKDLFTPQYWRTTILLWFVWFANAFCYFGIVLLTTELFQDGSSCLASRGAKIEARCSLECKNLTTSDYKDLIYTTLSEFPGLLVLLLIDRIGRKKSLALCFFMYCVFLLPIYACIGRSALTACIFIARAFSTGGFQIVFVYTPEVFPTQTRALAMGTSISWSRVGALITPFVAQVLLRTSQPASLSLYLIFGLLGGIASLLMPIETCGRGLEESGFNQEAGGQTSTKTSQSNDATHISDEIKQEE